VHRRTQSQRKKGRGQTSTPLRPPEVRENWAHRRTQSQRKKGRGQTSNPGMSETTGGQENWAHRRAQPRNTMYDDDVGREKETSMAVFEKCPMSHGHV
jgi:hypothetical protein